MTYFPSWSWNVLDVYNFNSPGIYDYWYSFLRSRLEVLNGDIVEVGVYRGRTFTSTCLLASQLVPGSTVWGYDTFSGFPPDYHKFDDISHFDVLLTTGQISQEHYNSIKLNKKLLSVVGRNLSVSSSSSSGNFSNTTKELVENKLAFFDLHNYKLVVGDVSATIYQERPDKVAAIFLDADLYKPYDDTLTSLWERLVPGGIIFLDEYYSLKFPGPREAVDSFMNVYSHSANLKCISRPYGEFERWIIEKL